MDQHFSRIRTNDIPIRLTRNINEEVDRNELMDGRETNRNHYKIVNNINAVSTLNCTSIKVEQFLVLLIGWYAELNQL